MNAALLPPPRIVNPKITSQHLQKTACVYIRQSTMGQVLHHQESTSRQYALRDKALTLGWSERQIRVLDRDLGQSGSQSQNREDFKTTAGRCVPGRGGCRARAGSLTVGALQHRLASTDRTLLAHRHVTTGRRRLLRSGRFQRRSLARAQRHHVGRGASFPARASSGWKAQQGRAWQVTISLAGRTVLERRRPDRVGPGRRSAGSRAAGLPILSPNGQRVWSRSTNLPSTA